MTVRRGTFDRESGFTITEPERAWLRQCAGMSLEA